MRCFNDSAWEQAKTQCESFDYLFQSAVQMKSLLNIDCSKLPLHGTYRVDDGKSAEPVSKKMKTGFHGMGQVDNASDLVGNDVPILPRDAKVLLLDIEGCTTSISFVKDTLFPFVLQHLEQYISTLSPEAYQELQQALERDLSSHAPDLIQSQSIDTGDIQAMVQVMVKNDFKLPSLKSMQGDMWKSGYEQSDLKGHVFADFVPTLHWMQNHGVKVYIYSSGSVQAQKLLFGYSEQVSEIFYDKIFLVQTTLKFHKLHF